jgi:hypothetical protein
VLQDQQVPKDQQVVQEHLVGKALKVLKVPQVQEVQLVTNIFGTMDLV